MIDEYTIKIPFKPLSPRFPRVPAILVAAGTVGVVRVGTLAVEPFDVTIIEANGGVRGGGIFDEYLYGAGEQGVGG